LEFIYWGLPKIEQKVARGARRAFFRQFRGEAAGPPWTGWEKINRISNLMNMARRYFRWLKKHVLNSKDARDARRREHEDIYFHETK
jgi:hypothetical protein